MPDTLIKWTDPNVLETGYDLYTSSTPILDTALPTPIALAANTTQYVDSTLNLGDVKNYRIGARYNSYRRNKWISANKKYTVGNLDIYMDFTEGFMYDHKTQDTPAMVSRITDTGSEGYIPDASGNFVLSPANSLSRTNAGLRNNPTRTNLCLYSNPVMNASWNALTGMALDPNTVVAPDGTLSATRVSYADPATSYAQYQTIAVTENTAYVWSYWAKLGTKLYNYYSIYDHTASAFIIPQTNASAVNANGWTRVIVPFTTPAGCTAVRVYFDRHLVNLSGPAGNTISIWNCQLEAGTFASDPILTTSTAVTRTGNRQQLDLLSRGVNTGVAGFFTFDQREYIGNEKIICFTSTGGQMYFYINGTILSLFCDAAVSGGPTGSVGGGTTVLGVQTIAFAISGNFVTWRKVGEAQRAIDTTYTLPSEVNFLRFGGLGGSTSTNNYQTSKTLALKFGPQNQTTFDQMYALAQIEAIAAPQIL